MRATGTNLREGMAQRLQDLPLRSCASFLVSLIVLTLPRSELPSAPPTTIFSNAPGLFMLNTRSGMFWSQRHRRWRSGPSSRNLRSAYFIWVKRSNFSAFGSLDGSAVYTPSR